MFLWFTGGLVDSVWIRIVVAGVFCWFGAVVGGSGAGCGLGLGVGRSIVWVAVFLGWV